MDRNAFLRRMVQQKQSTVNKENSILEAKIEKLVVSEINLNGSAPEVAVTEINTPLPETAPEAAPEVAPEAAPEVTINL